MSDPCINCPLYVESSFKQGEKICVLIRLVFDIFKNVNEIALIIDKFDEFENLLHTHLYDKTFTLLNGRINIKLNYVTYRSMVFTVKDLKSNDSWIFEVIFRDVREVASRLSILSLKLGDGVSIPYFTIIDCVKHSTLNALIEMHYMSITCERRLKHVALVKYRKLNSSNHNDSTYIL